MITGTLNNPTPIPGALPRGMRVDIVLLTNGIKLPQWEHGHVWPIQQPAAGFANAISRCFQYSTADYLLLLDNKYETPNAGVLGDAIRSGVDLAHVGLKQGTGAWWPDLCMVIQDWGMINTPVDRASNNWRVSSDCCLIRRELFLAQGGLDPAFETLSAAMLEFGFRSLKMGALVEYRPELLDSSAKLPEPPVRDLYTFIIRHFGLRWAKYLLVRRCMKDAHWSRERSGYEKAKRACTTAAIKPYRPFWFPHPPPRREDLLHERVSVIIPTLGRYPYLPAALDSIRRQTIRPYEVIVIDQNPRDERQPDVYKPSVDLNLKVIWQDEQGQSLARNAGLAAAAGTYVFLFDDDSIAHDDLIEAHLRMIVRGRFQVSTGVSYSPKPVVDQLPANFRYPRISRGFDTGNSMLATSLARSTRGLDRNYDFGSGTDVDFGTRLYLDGHRIVHNPSAIRIHFKAPMGGLRNHGAHKYNTDASLLGPFPPPTQTYYALRYLNKSGYREKIILQFVTSKYPKSAREAGSRWFHKGLAFLVVVLNSFLLPFKYYRSRKRAVAMLNTGPRFATFAAEK